MKNLIKLSNLLIIALMLTTYSCSNDDTNTVITLQDLEATIDENPTNGQVIGAVQSDSNSTLTFSITTQVPNGALTINESTGELTVADATLFDFETNPVITATVSAVGAANTAAVTINLTNVEVTVQDLTVAIDENPINGQVIGSVQSSGGADSNFSIVSQTPAGALNIDMITGELTVADAVLFDFETNPIITASISDSESANPAALTINLTNINEVIIYSFDESIDENPSNGQVIGTVQSNAVGNPNYSIVSQTPAGAININPNTGEVTVADASLFDYETYQFIDVVIAADDAVNSSDFELVIDNVNELGDFAYGGIIFWIDPTSNNSSGLVCAVSNQTISGVWGCDGTLIGTSSSLGSGAANTIAIEAGCLTAGTVVDQIANLSLNGYDDWFLPSEGELNEMYSNIDVVNNAITANGGQVTYQFHWSSTEVNANGARLVNLTTGVIGGSGKNGNLYFARAVRAWTDF